jgi:ribA/ribD-fused uncharacterized protein
MSEESNEETVNNESASIRQAELEKFYKGKSKKQNLFEYDDDGNLIEKNKEGEIIKTISLPTYRPPTNEEFDEMEETRMEAIALANKKYEDARRKLREAIINPETPDSEILRLNRATVEADIILQTVRSPLRHIEIKDKIKVRDINLEQPNETRKYPHGVYILKTRPFELQEQYVRIGKAPEKTLISVAEAKAVAESAASSVVILFAEPKTNDYGYLSLKWAVQLEFNATIYNSAHQAIYAEIAKSFNDQENLQKIMIAESPDAIDYKVEDVPGDSEVNETKWNDLTKQLLYDVNIAKFNQFPELAARLLETKDSMIGAYLPNDNLIGIGISLDNIQSQNPINWTGQNLLGKAIMDIRSKIRTEREIAIQATQITEIEKPLPRPTRRKAKSILSPTLPAQTEVVEPNAQLQVPVQPTIVPSNLEKPEDESRINLE